MTMYACVQHLPAEVAGALDFDFAIFQRAYKGFYYQTKYNVTKFLSIKKITASWRKPY